MRLERLRIERLRVLAAVDLEPGPGLNLLLGGNGAGKTSILEALHLLAYGRSFRVSRREALIAFGSERLSVYGEVRARPEQTVARLGFAAGPRRWEARIDGQPAANLSELFRRCAVVCFEPGSHALIGGGSELRRRYLDWGLFHVEPEFLACWRRYQRALRQRNVLLKGAPAETSLQPWELEMSAAGDQLNALRESYVEALRPHLDHYASLLLPEAGPAQLVYRPGWRSQEFGLAQALASQRGRDLTLGHCTLGPHRADWALGFARLPDRGAFSRGQEKLVALICLLAQAAHFAGRRGHWPILMLDDLGSELDREHVGQCLDVLLASGAQLLMSALEAPAGLDSLALERVVFHVEQGAVRRSG